MRELSLKHRGLATSRARTSRGTLLTATLLLVSAACHDAVAPNQNPAPILSQAGPKRSISGGTPCGVGLVTEIVHALAGYYENSMRYDAGATAVDADGAVTIINDSCQDIDIVEIVGGSTPAGWGNSIRAGASRFGGAPAGAQLCAVVSGDNRPLGDRLGEARCWPVPIGQVTFAYSGQLGRPCHADPTQPRSWIRCLPRQFTPVLGVRG